MLGAFLAFLRNALIYLSTSSAQRVPFPHRRLTPRRNNNAGLGKIPAENFRDLIGARSRFPFRAASAVRRISSLRWREVQLARALAVLVGLFMDP